MKIYINLSSTWGGRVIIRDQANTDTDGKRMSERKEPQNIIIFGSYDTDIVLIINK